MARSVTLATARARVREHGDFGPDTTSGRYPNDRINREFNQAWQRGREIATTKGDGQIYLKSATATMTPGAVANTSFGTIAMPSDLVAIHGIDVVFSSNDIVPLEAASWGDRNVFRDIYGGPTGRPIAFCPINIGTESTTTVTAGSIAIFPAPDSAYTYTIWYVPVWTDLTNDTHVFNGIAGHDDWAVWDAVIQLAVGDNDAQNVIQIAEVERGKAEEMLVSRVHSIQRVGPSRRRDVAGQSRRSRQLYWRRPR